MLFGCAKLLKVQQERAVYAIGETSRLGARHFIVLESRYGSTWRIRYHDTVNESALSFPDAGAGVARIGNTLVATGLAYPDTGPSDHAALSVSTDGGKTWAVVWAPYTPSASGVTVTSQAVAAGPAGFVRALKVATPFPTTDQSGGQYIAASAEGVSWTVGAHPSPTWTRPDSPFTETAGLNFGIYGGAAYGGGVFVACTVSLLYHPGFPPIPPLFGPSLQLFSSSDGASWSTTHDTPDNFDQQAISVAYLDGAGFVAVMHEANGNDPANRDMRPYYSADGSSWTDRGTFNLGVNIFSTTQAVQMAAAREKYLLLFDGGARVSSDLGVSWQSGASPGTVTAMNAVSDKFFAGGSDWIKSSADGATWQSATLPTLPSGHTYAGFVGFA